MTAPNPLAAMVRLYRISEHKSLRELAAEVGVAPATMHRVEQGKDMELSTWLAVQDWLLARKPPVDIIATLDEIGRIAPELAAGTDLADPEEPAA